MTKLNNEFIAQQKAIEFVKEYPNGDKFSFAQGFEYAMKLANNTEIIGSVSETLLAKYIDHVGQCEGVDFIDKCNHYSSNVKFTDKDIEHLERLR